MDIRLQREAMGKVHKGNDSLMLYGLKQRERRGVGHRQ
jgi:hypothetical protein